MVLRKLEKLLNSVRDNFNYLNTNLFVGVFCFEKPSFEADDIIGTYARLTEEAGGEAAILTGDRDSFQLVTEKVTVWFTKKGISELIMLTPDNLKENYGVEAHQVCDLKALMGDSSDNIPGVQGVGEKTALGLIEKYSSIEELYNHADEISGKMGEKIRAGKESAFDSKFLATIITDVPVASLEETLYRPVDDETASALFKKYQFKSLYERVGTKEEIFSSETLHFDNFNFSGNVLSIYIGDDEIYVATNEKKQYKISPMSFRHGG